MDTAGLPRRAGSIGECQPIPHGPAFSFRHLLEVIAAPEAAGDTPQK
ncbi:MAG: hypothetical protein AAFP17_08665 [Pseudomonadota bacterium]